MSEGEPWDFRPAAELARSLTEYFRATAGVFIPAWQSAQTRSRRSIGYARIGTSQKVPPPYPNSCPRATPFPELL